MRTSDLAKNSSYTGEYCYCGRNCVWSAINTNSTSFSTIEHFWAEFCIKTPYKVQLVQVKANWPSNAFSLRYVSLRSTYRKYRFWQIAQKTENEQGVAVTVNGNRYRAMLKEFLFTKIEEEDIGNRIFRFNRTSLRATQPKLHPMSCVLFLCNAVL